MILETINSPQDLKNLTVEQLNELSQQIRQLMIKIVANKGGHLASSLGAVELIIALHYCLNAPKDSIVFDVGHQTYAHKIITGRRDRFATMREFGGISGFPNFKESEYDPYICGHASAAISWAVGMAEAKKINQDDSHTVAVVGDGALTGGMSFEALNHAGHLQSNILVIVNHNEMSISPSVGALSRYLTKLITAPRYNKIKNEIEVFIARFSRLKNLAERAKKFEEAVKSLIGPGMLFEELGFRYFGVIDGHDYNQLIPTLKNVLALSGPRVLHVFTKKGKGYKYSEDNPQDFHSAPKFCVDKGSAINVCDQGFGEVFAQSLCEESRQNDKIVAITAAMPQGTGLDIFQKEFPLRFFDVGIAEEHAVGFASGLAKRGLRPVVAIYSTFLQRSFDQIIHDVALQELPIVFALDRAGCVGEDGPTHHGVFDLGYMRLVPGMVCMAPKDKQECQDMVKFAFSLNCPVSIRYPRGNAYSLNNHQPIKLGKFQLMRPGKEVCFLAIGSMVKNALEAADILKKQGLDPAVVNARFVKPLDEQELERIAEDYRVIITVEEENLPGGFGSAVLEYLQEKNFNAVNKIIRAGFPDQFITWAKREELFKTYGLDPQSLANCVLKKLNPVKSL